MVVCQPGTTEVAKSKDTIVCTDNTNGVASPASTSDNDSWRCQCLVLPVHPKEAIPYNNFLSFVLARSLTVARSGINPEYQNNKETVKYVEMANTSQRSGELKFTHTGPRLFGYGSIKKKSQTRPMCHIGNCPAHITANIVIASAARFTPVLHPWRKSNKMAEINVPA